MKEQKIVCNYNLQMSELIKFSLWSLILIAFQKSSLTQMITYIGLFIYSLTGIENSIKSMIITFLLSILNTNIVLFPSGFTIIIRWGVLFIAFFKVILYQLQYKRIRFNKSVFVFVLFILVNIVSSLIFSVDIKVSLLKLVSYCVGLYVCIYGMNLTQLKNWNIYFLYLAIIFTLASFSLLLFPELGYYYRNRTLFTGLINHPNILGALSLVILAFYHYMMKYIKKSQKFIIFLLMGMTYILIFLSKARGAIIFSTILIIIFIINYFINKKTSIKMIFLSVLASVMLMSCYNYYSFILDKVDEIIYKGDEKNIFASREDQFNRILQPFYDSPILGKGFGVDEYNIVKSDSFFSSPTEKGNIIFAILSESGILGLILFITFLLVFLLEFRSNRNCGLIVVIVSFLLSNMTEMTYFSMSNIGLINCMIMGLYTTSCIKVYES